MSRLLPSPRRYAMLLASLPPLGDMFSAERPPISRNRLEMRLGLMEPEDRGVLDEVAALLCWHRMDENASTSCLFARAETFITTHRGRFLAELVRERMELRSVVAALRLRQRVEATAEAYHAISFGSLRDVLHRRKSEEDFGLKHRYPWLKQGVRLFASGDSLGFERLLLGELWHQLDRLSYNHAYTLEAVILYVLRWDILERWTRYDAKQAMQRFEHLLEAAHP